MGKREDDKTPPSQAARCGKCQKVKHNCTCDQDNEGDK